MALPICDRRRSSATALGQGIAMGEREGKGCGTRCEERIAHEGLRVLALACGGTPRARHIVRNVCAGRERSPMPAVSRVRHGRTAAWGLRRQEAATW